MPLMADWFNRVFGEADDKQSKRDQGLPNLMKAFRRGEKMAHESWKLLVAEAERISKDGGEDNAMAATLLIFVAVMKMHGRCRETVEKFSKGDANAPVARMWTLLEAVFSAENPDEAMAAMHKVAGQWRDEQ